MVDDSIEIVYQSEMASAIQAEDGTLWPLPAAPGGGAVTIVVPPGVAQLTFTGQVGELHVIRVGLEDSSD
jgi:hypothetical protein